MARARFFTIQGACIRWMSEISFPQHRSTSFESILIVTLDTVVGTLIASSLASARARYLILLSALHLSQARIFFAKVSYPLLPLFSNPDGWLRLQLKNIAMTRVLLLRSIMQTPYFSQISKGFSWDWLAELLTFNQASMGFSLLPQYGETRLLVIPMIGIQVHDDIDQWSKSPLSKARAWGSDVEWCEVGRVLLNWAQGQEKITQHGHSNRL